MNETELQYLIALTQIDRVGPVVGKELIRHFGSASQVFHESPRLLARLKKVGPYLAAGVTDKQHLLRAGKELEFIKKNGITALSYQDEGYPVQLKECSDSPLVLFCKGSGSLKEAKTVSIVGTRESTSYGRDFVKALVTELATLDVAIHSGLAYGIDIAAHEQALLNNIPTYCTLAHGLDRIYPARHRKTAQKMLESGGWITEFLSGTIPDRENFPRRNRIVAGLSEATVVVESARKGGSLITAYLANSYGREVFALPGRVTDDKSKGCNFLIKTNRAHLVEKPNDLVYLMGWDQKKVEPVQTKLFDTLSPTQKKIIGAIQHQSVIRIDELMKEVDLTAGELSATLLTMEFNGLVKQLPGKQYELA